MSDHIRIKSKIKKKLEDYKDALNLTSLNDVISFLILFFEGKQVKPFSQAKKEDLIATENRKVSKNGTISFKGKNYYIGINLQGRQVLVKKEKDVLKVIYKNRIIEILSLQS